MNDEKIILTEGDEFTLVSNFKPAERVRKEHQTEQELEDEFVENLIRLGYGNEIFKPKNKEDMLNNIRVNLEKLNSVDLDGKGFTDLEWERYLNTYLLVKKDSFLDKTYKFQKNNRFAFQLDNGKHINIRIIDANNVGSNVFQILRQHRTEGKQLNIYDVNILINGIPLVHIELKQRGVSIKEAFNQIKRYDRQSFSDELNLFDYTQIYIISNGTETKYFSNTIRESALEFNEKNRREGRESTPKSFEFTNYWADANKEPIKDLVDFTETFLTKRVLLKMLTKYSVFNEDQNLMIMRPYQVSATEKILSKINQAINDKTKFGKRESGGYIWHTTGSGKTLTSFKTATLAMERFSNDIGKILFVVDRKDLDQQTREEYDNYEKGTASGVSSTNDLIKKMNDNNVKLVITTIQKLNNFVNNKKHKDNKIFKENVIFIFDECHRTQFGKMHTKIRNTFKKHLIFGFTGTPIFEENSPKKGADRSLFTTKGTFGNRLDTYTMKDAISDGNVLKFRIEYKKTMNAKDNIKDEKVLSINKEEVYQNKDYIKMVVKDILDNYNRLTKNKKYNAILAVDSINTAKLYYEEFELQTKEFRNDFNFTTIFSKASNEPDVDGIYDENNESIEDLDSEDGKFLQRVINKFNDRDLEQSINNYDFRGFYSKVSREMKDRKLDLLIVVNMFLTGFDAKKINTLFLNKNLKYHGLIQAFSRTNRIYDSTKSFGNIVSYRDLRDEVVEAIRIFGDESQDDIILVKSFDEFYIDYKNTANIFLEKHKLPLNLLGEKEEADFIKDFNNLIRLISTLEMFPEFEDKKIISDFDLQDFRSNYISLYDKYRGSERMKTSIIDDLEFEIELLSTQEVNVDFILDLVNNKNPELDKEITKMKVEKYINSEPSLKNKKDLIMNFLESKKERIELTKEDFNKLVRLEMKKEVNDLIKKYNLNEKETQERLKIDLKKGSLTTRGNSIERIFLEFENEKIKIFDPKYRSSLKNKIKNVENELRLIIEKYRDL